MRTTSWASDGSGVGDGDGVGQGVAGDDRVGAVDLDVGHVGVGGDGHAGGARRRAAVIGVAEARVVDGRIGGRVGGHVVGHRDRLGRAGVEVGQRAGDGLGIAVAIGAAEVTGHRVDDRRLSTVSLRVMASAWLTPVFWTLTLNVWPPVPASTGSSPKVLVVTRVTSSTMSTVSEPRGRAGEVVGVGRGRVADAAGRLGGGRDVIADGDRAGRPGIEAGEAAVDRLAAAGGAVERALGDRIDDAGRRRRGRRG